jgi:hypothetical protein
MLRADPSPLGRSRGLGSRASDGWSSSSWLRCGRSPRAPSEQIRRIGVLLPAAADNQVFQAWVGAFLKELAVLGQTIGAEKDQYWSLLDHLVGTGKQ